MSLHAYTPLTLSSLRRLHSGERVAEREELRLVGREHVCRRLRPLSDTEHSIVEDIYLASKAQAKFLRRVGRVVHLFSLPFFREVLHLHPSSSLHFISFLFLHFRLPT